jgi:hypothetical protein
MTAVEKPETLLRGYSAKKHERQAQITRPVPAGRGRIFGWSPMETNQVEKTVEERLFRAAYQVVSSNRL